MKNTDQIWLIFAALKPELKPFHKAYSFKPVAGFKNVYEASISGQVNNAVRVILAYTGIGLERSERIAKRVIQEFKPGFILSVGTCGGLEVGFDVGDLVLVSSIGRRSQSLETFQSIIVDEALLSAAQSVSDQTDLICKAGRLVSSPKALASPDEKAELGQLLHAQAVDMESAALAEVAQSHAIPFLCVRGILDPLDRNLFSHSEELQPNEEGELTRAFATYMLSHPFDIKKVPFLWQGTRKVAYNLKCFIEVLIKELNGA